MKKILLLIGMFMFLIQPAFCASVVIENYTPEELKPVLMKYFITHNATIVNATDYSLTAQEYGNSLTNVLYGSRFNPNVLIKISLNFVKDKNNTILSADMERVLNKGSAFESFIPFPDTTSQSFLNGMKRMINGYYGYGFDAKKKGKYYTIINVNADTADLRAGDKIYEIGNEAVKGMSKDYLEKKLKVSDDKTVLNVKFLRNKQEKEALLKSRFIKPVILKEK